MLLLLLLCLLLLLLLLFPLHERRSASVTEEIEGDELEKNTERDFILHVNLEYDIRPHSVCLRVCVCAYALLPM